MDLGRRLDVAAGMEVQHRIEAAFATGLSGTVQVVDQESENAIGGQRCLRVVGDLPRPAQPLRLQRRIGEDDLGHEVVGTRRGHVVEDPDHLRPIGSGVLRPTEALGHESCRPATGVARRAAPRNQAGITEVARRTQLGAGVPGRRHLVQHRLGRELQGVALGLLEDAPRHRRGAIRMPAIISLPRRTRAPCAGSLRTPCGRLRTLAEVETSATATSHQLS